MEIKATNFYVDRSDVDDDSLILSETESHHLVRVFRAKKGDLFSAIDGQGIRYKAMIKTISSKKVSAEIINTIRLENEPLTKLSLAIGLSRSSKIDLIIEKATEIGVSRFVTFYSENTLVDYKSDTSLNRKLGRWRKLAASAAKQSLRTMIPEIIPPVTLDELIRSVIEYDHALISDMSDEPVDLDRLAEEKPRDVLLLIGPESGFTDPERKRITNGGFKPVKFGPRRLRFETAAIVAPSIVLQRFGDL